MEDRISQLPNAILQQILSSLDLKQAVQTTLLSKRWLHLWSTLPDLHFDFTGLAARDGVVLAGHPCTSQTFMHRFTHFITHFLSHRDHTSTIHKFHLSSSYLIDIDPEFVNQCVGYAASHGVRHLSLDVMCDYETPFAFPEAFFACKTLRVLKLRRNCSGMVVPKPFVLPCLVTLHLECFDFRDDHDFNDCSFSREPFSGLPDLENLYLRQCRISGLIILAPKLEFLEISFHDIDTLTSREADVDRIWTPRLTSFRYEGYLPLDCPNLEFPLVEEVFLNISTHLLSAHRVDRKMFLDSVGMLQQLGNAMFVTLSLDTLEVLEFDPHFVEERWSPFPNTKCLRVTEAAGCHATTKRRVVRAVMNYLTRECRWDDSMVVKLPEGVSVIEYEAAGNLSEEEDDGYDSDDMRLHCLFT